MKRFQIGGVAMTLCLLLGRIAGAQSAIKIVVDEKSPTYTIAEEFTGLSYEMQAVLPDEKGQHLFRADNAPPLIAIFKTLGIRTLRLGGSSADLKSVPIPSDKDLGDLFAFAKAVGVRVMFTLRLRDGDLTAATRLAKYILDPYQSQMICFSVGNEPNLYISDYAGYVDAFKKYVTAIRVVLPESRFCGPGTSSQALAWANTFASEFNNRNFAVVVTVHDSIGDASSIREAAEGRKALLSPAWVDEAGQKAQTLVGVFRQGFGYRLEEAACFSGAGCEGASNSMAAALWGLEYLNFWGWNGCGGVNLSGGDFVAGDSGNMPNWNAPFESKDRGISARPLAYAIKAFDLSRRGRIAKIELSGNDERLNLSAYAILGADQNLYVTIINKENGSGARSAKASIQTADAYARAEFLRLEAPKNDAAATSGVTLGGAGILEDGRWNGQWAPLQTPNLSVTAAPASAVVIRLLPK